MVKIDKYISELLYDHECVIVPELGGFLGSYIPSKIHAARHMVSPPAKKIAFNVYLKQNDGLLANHLVQAESVTYPEALREIEHYVRNCLNVLGAGNKFVIERVGILTRDSESNLQFESFNNINYLKDSFGLSPVQFIPVANSEFEQQVEKQLRDFISLRPSQAQQRTGIPRKKVRLNALNTMLLSGSILWLCLNLYIVSPTKVNFASLNPFTVASDTEISATPEVLNPEIYTQPSIAKTETVYVSSTTPVAESGSLKESPSEKLEHAINTKTTADSFFIIAGAFSSKVNASKKAAELRAQGFADANVIENAEGLKLVCYDGFPTREGAMDELNRLKALNKEGWIFSR